MSLKQRKGKHYKWAKPHRSLTNKFENRDPNLPLKFRFNLFLVSPFISLIKHYKIRDDFLQIYTEHVNEMYRNPRLFKPASLGRRKWGKRISDVREESLTVDPHKQVTQLIDFALAKYRLVKELLSNCLEWILFGLVVIFFISMLLFSHPLNGIPLFEPLEKIITYCVILPILGLIVCLIIYRHILKSDTELFHLINAKMAYTSLDVYRCQRYPRYNNSNLIAMVIWNKSLSNYTMYTIIFSMLFLKIVSRRLIYPYLFKALKEITPKYLEAYSKRPRDMSKIRREMYSEWQDSFKIWWNETRRKRSID
jgi:hypothetical protein